MAENGDQTNILTDEISDVKPLALISSTISPTSGNIVGGDQITIQVPASNLAYHNLSEDGLSHT